MGGWGPFEMLSMCEAAGIEPIITTPSQDERPRHSGNYDCCNTTDMADLVEYCYGNSTTTWGEGFVFYFVVESTLIYMKDDLLVS